MPYLLVYLPDDVSFSKSALREKLRRIVAATPELSVAQKDVIVDFHHPDDPKFTEGIEITSDRFYNNEQRTQRMLDQLAAELRDGAIEIIPDTWPCNVYLRTWGGEKQATSRRELPRRRTLRDARMKHPPDPGGPLRRTVHPVTQK